MSPQRRCVIWPRRSSELGRVPSESNRWGFTRRTRNIADAGETFGAFTANAARKATRVQRNVSVAQAELDQIRLFPDKKLWGADAAYNRVCTLNLCCCSDGDLTICTIENSSADFFLNDYWNTCTLKDLEAFIEKWSLLLKNQCLTCKHLLETFKDKHLAELSVGMGVQIRDSAPFHTWNSDFFYFLFFLPNCLL